MINPKSKKVFILIMNIVFAILISEIVLQVIDKPERRVSGWKKCAAKNPGECNSMGFRGKEIEYSPDDLVVLLVGDSAVYSYAFSFEQMPEKRLEHHLKNYLNKVKVFTIGDMGYGQDQQYLALKEYYEKYRADLVLLLFAETNDVEDNMFPVTGLNNTIKPTFWLENGELKGPTGGLLEPAGSRIKLVLFWQRNVSRTLGGESFLRRWAKEKLPPPYQPESHYQGETDYTWHKEWLAYPKNIELRIGNEMIGPTNLYTPRSKRREYGYELTRKLLSEMKKLVETHNGRFIIFKEVRPFELEDIEMEKAYFIKDKYYKISMKQYHNNIKELFEGFEFYEIPLSMEDVTNKGRDEHLNYEAVDELMKKLSMIVLKNHIYRNTFHKAD
jgi:hypothetical protein